MDAGFLPKLPTLSQFRHGCACAGMEGRAWQRRLDLPAELEYLGWGYPGSASPGVLRVGAGVGPDDRLHGLADARGEWMPCSAASRVTARSAASTSALPFEVLSKESERRA